jgi:hypothetical protein
MRSASRLVVNEHKGLFNCETASTIKLIVGYSIVPASFYDNLQLVVKLISILISEGAQFAPATLQTFAEGDQAAPQNANLQTTNNF